MKDLFYNIYKYTSKRWAVSAFFFSLFVGVAAFFAFQIELEEDIFNVIPKDDKVEQVNEALEGFKMNNRLIVHLYFADTSKVEPDGLIKHASDFADSLQQNYSQHIDSIRIEFDEGQITTLYNYFLKNIPFYLAEEDYETLEKRFSQEGIEETVERGYRNLLSPVSIVSKRMLLQDPFGLVGIPLEKMGDMQLDENMQLYQNYLLTQDRKHLIFFISLSNAPSDTEKNSEFIDGIEELTAVFEDQAEGLNIEHFGSAAVSVANANRIKSDIYITVTVALVFLFFFISFFYKDFTIFFIAITPGIFGAIVAIALLAIFRGTTSAISLGVGSVLLGITIDYALHFITHFKHQKDVRQLFKDLTVPILMSSVTTSCAFFSLLFLSSNALADLGLFAGVSVVSAAIFTITVLPHLVLRKKDRIKVSKQNNFVERAVQKVSSYPYFRSKWALILFFLLTTISLFTWRDYYFESNMLKLSYMPEHLEAYEKNLNDISTYSANNLYLVSGGKTIWEALETEDKIARKLDSLREAEKIYHYVTVNTMIPARSVQDQRLIRWNDFWREEDVDNVLAKFYAETENKGFKKEAFATLEQTLRKDYTHLNQEDLNLVFDVFGEELIIEGDERISVITSAKMSTEQKPSVMKVFEKMPETIIFDQGYMTNRLITLLQEDFNKLVNISLAVVFIIILLSYGRIELALVAFTPILLSWLWILGVMGLFGLSFNIVNIIICTFIFGLGIDYSIFVMQGLTQNYKYGINNIISYKKSIVLSAVTTLVGIGVLAFAQHPALRSIALLAIIGIISVIFLSFTIQPVLYNLLIQNRKEKGFMPYSIGSILITGFAFGNFLFGCFLLYTLRLILAIPIGNVNARKKFFHRFIMLFCRYMIYVMVNIKKEIRDLHNMDFSRPSVIISNHHSFIDILILLMFNPKVVMVTNDWVYYSPLFGKSVQFADFIHAGKGVEKQLDHIENLIDEGYSIVIYPEGTRSESFKLGRFHKGAFFLAERFKLDIQPVVLHGTNYTMPKKDSFLLRNCRITVKFLPRIKHDDLTFGEFYSERTKKISRYFKNEYEKIRIEQEKPKFFTDIILKNYIYKGPVLEWYVRVKMALEGYYKELNEIIPGKGRVVDLGCGYGYTSLGLALSRSDREILGIDYDHEKIEIAKNIPTKLPNLSFDHGDVVTYPYQETEVFILNDVLHYLLPEEQDLLLENMAGNLVTGGIILIREGDSSQSKRHKGTLLTELFSTKSGFNKTKNSLNFISKEMIEAFASRHHLELETVDNTKLTSNTLFILRKI